MQFLPLKLSFLLLFCAIAVQSQSNIQSIVNFFDEIIKNDVFEVCKRASIFIESESNVSPIEVGPEFISILTPFDTLSPIEKKKREGISEKLSEIEETVSSLNFAMIDALQIENPESKLQIYENFTSLFNEIRQNFTTIIGNYNDTQSPEFAEELKTIIESQANETSESKIVSLFVAPQSIIDEIVLYCQGRKTNFTSTVPSSTGKILQNIYFDLLKKILKSFAYRVFAINLRKKTLPNEESNDIQQFTEDKTNVLAAFVDSFQKTAANLTDEDFKGFTNLQPNGDDKFVRFRNVFQTFIAREEDVSLLDTCDNSCSDYKRQEDFDQDGCIGTTQVSNEDRIYYAYNYTGIGWSGNFTEEPDYNIENDELENYLLEESECEICKCTCDQKNHPNTVRKIFVGKVQAPDGFVVTGVRFVEDNFAIALQIQVGKLLPTALVDGNSIRWEELPNNRLYEFLTYQSTLKLGLSDDLKFEAKETVVTGVQLVKQNRFIKLQIIGRSITNVTDGSLSEEEVTISPTIAEDIVKTGGQIGVKKEEDSFVLKSSGQLEFRKSDEATDAGQNLVPYFDANEVDFYSRGPITSVGIIHYTNNEEFAGYIKPTIKSLDWNILI